MWLKQNKNGNFNSQFCFLFKNCLRVFWFYKFKTSWFFKNTFCFLILTQGDFFPLLFSEVVVGREMWERTSMWERNFNWFPSCMCPSGGLDPQPGYVHWLGIEPVTFWSMVDAPTNWATQARAKKYFCFIFMKQFYKVILENLCVDVSSFKLRCYSRD